MFQSSILNKYKTLILIIIIAILSFTVHFVFFGYPQEVVFDEVHFGKFITGYEEGKYFFDIHPPLGKLIIFGFSKLFHYNPDSAFGTIGELYPDHQYQILRFLPTLAGALLPLIIFFIARVLNFSRRASFLVGILVTFENALVVQSRFILLDSFLLLFGFSALLFYFYYCRKQKIFFLILAAILAAASFSIKWTGLTFLAIILIIELINFWKLKNKTTSINNLALLFIISLVFYFSVFTIHFTILGKSGPGDAFMSRNFQHTLQGNIYSNSDSYLKPNLIQKFVELNSAMFSANQRLKSTHAYSSKWYTWPVLERPIFYWQNQNSRIYLLGNPLIWWLASLAVIVAIFGLILRKLIPSKTILILLAGYFINLLPFIFIGRVMFLYHYLIALIFSILILVYLLERTPRFRINSIILTVLAIISFIYFSPLTYGLTLPEWALSARVWFSSWR